MISGVLNGPEISPQLDNGERSLVRQQPEVVREELELAVWG
jgi:hypothetical protein